MKFSNVLLLGLTIAAAAVVAKRVMRMNSDSILEDDVIFDSEFLPGSKKHFKTPYQINSSWYRAAAYHGEDGDPMFI